MDEATVWVLAWAGFGGVIGMAVGSAKGRAFAGALWGVALGPIGWLLVAMGPDMAQRRAKRCPHCLGLLPIGQRECAHCNRGVVWVRGEPRKPSGMAKSISQ